MITIKPITEEAILEIFNKGRFDGDVEGMIASDGTGCIGHCLYRIDGGMVRMLDAQVRDPSLLDGVIRAGLAAAQSAGATGFWVEDNDLQMTRWREAFCKNASAPIDFDVIFHTCCG